MTDTNAAKAGTPLGRALFKAWVVITLVLCIPAVSVFLGTHILRDGASITANEVMSDSMEPTYPVGSFVWLIPATGADLVVGRAVAINGPSGGDPYVHRVEALNADGTATLRGDNRDSVDLFKPTQANVAGVPITVTTGIYAFVFKWLTDPRFIIGLFVFCMTPFVIQAIVNALLNRRDMRAWRKAQNAEAEGSEPSDGP